AVGADEPDEAARGDVQVHAVEGDHPAEAHGEAAHLQQGAHRRARAVSVAAATGAARVRYRPLALTARAAAPAMPPGTRRATATRPRPLSRRWKRSSPSQRSSAVEATPPPTSRP